MQQNYARVSAFRKSSASPIWWATPSGSTPPASCATASRSSSVHRGALDRHRPPQGPADSREPDPQRKYALDDSDRPTSGSHVTIEPGAENHVRIIVADNGGRIPKENCSACSRRASPPAATATGSACTAGRSPPRNSAAPCPPRATVPGRGATFVLELPLTYS